MTSGEVVPEGHTTDEQIAIEQERVDEERETSFQFQKEARAVESLAPAQAGAPAETLATSEPSAAENRAEAPAEAAAEVGDEAAAASSSKTVRSARKSGTSGSGTSPLEAGGEQAKKRARKSTQPSAGAATPSDAALNADANVRLDRLRQALFRFLDLIEHRATQSSFAKALPHIDEESVEALRQQFVRQLKDAIIDESEKLIESNELEAKLASLHRLAQEADARYQAGYQEDAEEIKDVWRKDLDLETAISARAIPDQERRINELKAELELVRKQNKSIYAELLDTRSRCDAIQTDARDSLDALDSVSCHQMTHSHAFQTLILRPLPSLFAYAVNPKIGDQRSRSYARYAKAATADYGRFVARSGRSCLISTSQCTTQMLQKLFSGSHFAHSFAEASATAGLSAIRSARWLLNLDLQL